MSNDKQFANGTRLRKTLFFLLFRSIRFFRRKKFSYDTIISYGGFIVSIAVLTASLSLLYGYQKALKEGILGVNGHIYLYNYDRRTIDAEDLETISGFLNQQDEVRAFSPVLMTQGMAVNPNQSRRDIVHTPSQRVKGVLIRSIEWEKSELPTNYNELVIKGRSELTGFYDAVVGEKLAAYLSLDINDTFNIISPANVRYTIYGLRSGELTARVAGIYRSGVYDTDSKTVFLNEDAIRTLTGERDANGGYNHIEVAVKDNYTDVVNPISGRWSVQLEHEYQIYSWIDYNGNLFTMLVLQRWVIFIILSFIILIASFGIVSNTAKTVMEKQKELGILAAVGADNLLIKSYIMGETIMLGILSVIAGVITGIILSWALTKQTVLMLKGDVYFIETFSTHVNPVNLLLIMIVSISTALIASYIALNRISRLTVIETVAGK